jgi:hypothetical protein
MIDYEKKIIQIKEKINAVTADLIVLQARLSHLERQRDQKTYERFMRSRRKPA